MTARVLDYLGRPCEFNRARERFGEAVAEARKSELRELKQRIARNLHDVVDREEISREGLVGAISLLSATTEDSDHVGAILSMACAYGITTANKIFVLAGQVVALLDRMEEAQQGSTAEGGAA